RTKIGCGLWLTNCSPWGNNRKNAAPNTPGESPRNKHHGNYLMYVHATTEDTCHGGPRPENLSETSVASTEASTTGADKLIETPPSTSRAAKTARGTGALYAAAMAAAAPQATSRRNRYGCQRASCPHLDAVGAVKWVINPSRPIEPPVLMVSREEIALTRAW